MLLHDATLILEWISNYVLGVAQAPFYIGENKYGPKGRSRIGQLHDDVIWLQLPESLSLLFSYAN